MPTRPTAVQSEVLLSRIEPEWSVNQWLTWLAEESTPEAIRMRFGDDEESLVYWKDDYYSKLEQWWASALNRVLDPVQVGIDKNGVIRIVDGWHRVAISHRLGLLTIPCQFPTADKIW